MWRAAVLNLKRRSPGIPANLIYARLRNQAVSTREYTSARVRVVVSLTIRSRDKLQTGRSVPALRAFHGKACVQPYCKRSHQAKAAPAHGGNGGMPDA